MATKSIVSNERVCWVCGTPYGLHKHHVYGGANRKWSEKYGCWVYLCGKHHNLDTKEGVHFNKELDNKLKDFTQKRFEAHLGTREDFMAIFGRNYIL